MIKRLIRKIRYAVSRRLLYFGIIQGNRAFTGPRYMQIDLTNDCNNNCIGCWCNSPLLGKRSFDDDMKRVHLPLKRVMDIIDDASRLGVRGITLAGGGEPTRHPHCMEIIRRIKEKGMAVYLNTNFVSCTPDMIDELVRLDVDMITISVWAGTPSGYARTHPNKNDDFFRDLELRVKYCCSRKRYRRARTCIKIYHVILRNNASSLRTLYDFAYRVGADQVEYALIDTIPGKTDVLAVTDEQCRDLIQEAVALEEHVAALSRHRMYVPQLNSFDHFKRRLTGARVHGELYDADIIDTMPCYAGWAFARVLPNGDVNGCLKAHRIAVGNIHHGSFRLLWFSAAYNDFRRQALQYRADRSFATQIGNNESLADGCRKGCDNVALNEEIDRELKNRPVYERALLVLAGRLFPRS